MYIAPNTAIKILNNCPLNPSYAHTIYFSNTTAQVNYFAGLTKYSLSNQSYQRANKGSLKVEVPCDDLYDCNYMMFQNTAFGNKWFYAFITDVEYINNVTSLVTYEIDVMQTWFFDYEIKPSFVERECVLDDTPFKWLAPESFSPSGYICDVQNGFWPGYTSVLGLEPYITMAMTKGAEIGLDPDVYSGIYSGLYYYSAAVSNHSAITSMINTLDEAGKGDSIVAIFMSPFPVSKEEFNITRDTNVSIVNTDFNGYTIKNKKLLQYPYCRIKVKSTDGNEMELKPELVNGDTLTVKLWFATSMAPTITLTPTYGDFSANWDYAVQYTENPQCAWSNNVFANWQAQNQVSNTINKIAAVANLTTGVIELSGGMGAKSAESSIESAGQISSIVRSFSPWATEHTMSTLPGKAGGTPNSGSVNYAFGRIGFEVYRYTVEPGEAKIFDDYLSMYGYAINTIKVPNRSGRPIWNYVKTQNIGLTGSAPASALAKIASIYDSGVTFWNSGSSVGNYGLDNSI